MPEIEEVWADDVLLCFDGRVVEIFGFPGSESIRFHVKNLELSADGPDRKRRYTVHMQPAARGGGCVFNVPEEDWPAVAAFIDHVLAAMPVVEEAVE